MKRSTFWMVLLLLGLGLYAGWRYYLHPQPPATPVADQPQLPAAAEEPPIRYPVPAALPAAGMEPAAPTAEPAPPLPALEESDGAVRAALERLWPGQPLDQLLLFDNLVKRVVITTDNLMGKSIPVKRRPTQPPAGAFLVAGSDSAPVINPQNQARYAPFIRLVEAAETRQLIALYVRFYPLLQQAYQNLGYRGYFNDRLIAMLDLLLATPQVEEPIRLVRPEVLYRFADPQLEALASGQKLLLRMGRENGERLKAKLRELREALVALPGKMPP
jgi:Protein of unknown function (DUF3014)